MALQQSFADEFGSTHSTAYFRVIRLVLDYMQKSAAATMGVFKDAAASAAGKDALARWSYEYSATDFDNLFLATPMDAKNPIKAVYDDVKTKDEFTGATDV